MNSFAAIENPVHTAMDAETLMNFALLRFGLIVGGGLLVVLVAFTLLMIFKRRR
ncbi:hypothetical protein [Streptomyces sp. NPDC007100]|uniref:hypothetical protein n=1 Tax=unclassified Streptomyces TaxID=2593676 RepID=UPI0033C71EE0